MTFQLKVLMTLICETFSKLDGMSTKMVTLQLQLSISWQVEILKRLTNIVSPPNFTQNKRRTRELKVAMTSENFAYLSIVQWFLDGADSLSLGVSCRGSSCSASELEDNHQMKGSPVWVPKNGIVCTPGVYDSL